MIIETIMSLRYRKYPRRCPAAAYLEVVPPLPSCWWHDLADFTMVSGRGLICLIWGWVKTYGHYHDIAIFGAIFGWKTLHSQATLGFDSSPYEWGEWLKHTKSSCSKAFKTHMCHCQVTCFTHVYSVFLMAIYCIFLMPCSWWSSWDLWSYRIDEYDRRACGSAFKL